MRQRAAKTRRRLPIFVADKRQSQSEWVFSKE